MNTLVATYWPAIVAALVIGLVLAWYLFHASRRTRVTGARPGPSPSINCASVVRAYCLPAAAPYSSRISRSEKASL